MSRIVLVTNPSDDASLKYLDSWTKLIIEAVKRRKDTLVFELRKEKANKQLLSQFIQKEKPQLIVFNGHGSNISITGFHGEVLIRCNDNESLLKEKIIHSMSCNSGKILGQMCIKIGTLSYIGYSEKFKLAYLKKETRQEILNDPVAAFFLEPAFEVIVALISGDTTGDAYRKSQKMYARKLRALLASSSTEYNTTVASRLFHNFKYQVCLGDLQASF